MTSAVKILALAGMLAVSSQASQITVSGAPPANASAPIPEAFVSFSIEFAFFPDYAGMPFNSVM
jgi:hypothetical protein